MQVALIPDEYTHDPFTAFELGRGWGVRHYELRYAYRWRLPQGPRWVNECVVNAVQAYGVVITALSAGLFKPTMETDGTMVPVSAERPEQIRRHLEELLPRQLEFAAQLGTRYLTVFSLPRPSEATGGPAPAVVIDTLAAAAEQAAANGFTLLLENGAGLWADTGRATAEIVEAVGSEALKVTWDPANVVYGGLTEKPVEEGFPAVSGQVGNVHVKDARFGGGQGEWVQMGEGVVPWRKQLAALAAAGYDGCLTLEPHLQYQPGVTHLVREMEVFLQRVRELASR